MSTLTDDMDAIYAQYAAHQVSRSTMLTMRNMVIVESLRLLKEQLEQKYPENLPVVQEAPVVPIPVPSQPESPVAEEVDPTPVQVTPAPVEPPSPPPAEAPVTELVPAPVVPPVPEPAPTPEEPAAPSPAPVDLNVLPVPQTHEVVEEPFTL